MTILLTQDGMNFTFAGNDKIVHRVASISVTESDIPPETRALQEMLNYLRATYPDEEIITA